MATPSLAMIPSGYKASKVYSVLPESGVGDFDFTRATTATRVNSSGLIEEMAINVPRLEYPLIDGVVNGCPSLLLEPQSLNQIINSENLSNSSWGKINTVVESNSTISPNGTLTADKLTFNTSGNFARIISSTLTSVNSVSFFVKYIDLEYILIFVGTSSNGVYVNLKEGYATSTVIGAGLDITFKKYPNDWLRIEASGANNGTSLEIYAANSIPNYNPITLNGSFYLWGIQTETNSYPTSYIPTNGSTVTRNAETCTGAGDAATFSDSEGVLMVEAATLVELLTQNHIISIHDGTTNNRVRIYWREDVPSELIFSVFDGGVLIYTYTTTSIALDDMNKICLRYGSNNFSAWANGFKLDEQTSGGSLTLQLNTLDFNKAIGSASNAFYGNTKQIQYYNSVLTESEIEKLTSWTSFSDMANGQQYSII